MRARHIKVTITILLLLLVSSQSFAWEPDAGLIVSLTRNRPVNVTSNNETAENIVDGQSDTFWQSGACLPTGYISRQDLNHCLGACIVDKCTATGESADIHLATDGTFYGGPVVEAIENQQALFTISFDAERNAIRRVHLRASYNNETTLSVTTSQGEEILAILTPDDSYTDVIIVSAHEDVMHISIYSYSNFQVFEIATLSHAPCYEMAVVYIGLQEVGVISTRHWAGTDAAYATELLVSENGYDWLKINDLDPDNLDTYTTRLEVPLIVRYIGVKHYVYEIDYQKCYVWDISAYDKYGSYGPFPQAAPNPISMKDMLGVNGIWGWQTGSYSDDLPPTQGTQLYSQINSHARNYHNMNWDILDPTSIPDYDAMANGEGTEVHWWLNWDREYVVWSRDFDIAYATVQFTNKPNDMPYEKWTDPYENGYNFGYAYAKHFGNGTGTGHIYAMEIGNEPWDYPLDFYPEVFLGMAKGAFDAESDILIFPCALQGHDEFASTNYLGHNFNETHALYVNGVNTHIYSFLRTEAGERIAVHPEHPDSGFNEIRNTLRWRNVNVPNLPVWVTEWGWDSNGVGEDCANTECVSEELQAVYGLRGLMILSRLGIEKAAWFFYANSENCNTLFCRSGLTSSVNMNFTKKKVFNAFDAFLNIIENDHFNGVVMEDNVAFVYKLGDAVNGDNHLVMWVPTDEYDAPTKEVTFDYIGNLPDRSWVITGENDTGEEVANPIVVGDNWTVQLTAKPMVVRLK